MTIEQMTLMSEILLVVAIVLAVAAVVIFFGLDVRRAWHFATGRPIKEKPAKAPQQVQTTSGSIRSNISKKMQSTTQTQIITDNDAKMSYTEKLVFDMNHSSPNATEIIEENSTRVLAPPTVVISDAQSNATTLLPEALVVEQDIILIHTPIRIAV